VDATVGGTTSDLATRMRPGIHYATQAESGQSDGFRRIGQLSTCTVFRSVRAVQSVCVIVLSIVRLTSVSDGTSRRIIDRCFALMRRASRVES